MRMRASRAWVPTVRMGGVRVGGVKDNIRAKVKDGIKQFVIDNSWAHDASTGSYMQVFSSRLQPGTVGLGSEDVIALLHAAGVCDALTGTENTALNIDYGCYSDCDPCGHLGNAVTADVGGGGPVGWGEFMASSKLSPLAPPPPAPAGKTTIFGAGGDYKGENPPSEVPAGQNPSGIAIPEGDTSGDGFPYWYVDAPSGDTPSDTGPGMTHHEGLDRFGALGLLVAKPKQQILLTTKPKPVVTPAQPSEAFDPLVMKCLAADKTKTIIQCKAEVAAAAKPLTTTTKVAVGVGLPAIVGGLASIKWGWMGLATGGVAGLALAGIGLAIAAKYAKTKTTNPSVSGVEARTGCGCQKHNQQPEAIVGRSPYDLHHANASRFKAVGELCLLEDHMINDPCPDCMNKHAITASRLMSEAATLEGAEAEDVRAAQDIEVVRQQLKPEINLKLTAQVRDIRKSIQDRLKLSH